MKKIFLSVLAIAIISLTAYGQIPRVFNYQASLQNESGDPLGDGSYSGTFAIFDSETGGFPLWVETQEVIVNRGYVNIYLGRLSPINLSFDKQYWLEVKIGNGTPFPRTALTSVPTALNANTAVFADTSAIALTVADSSITQPKLAKGVQALPWGPAGGDLSGTYPNPLIAKDAVTSSKILDKTILNSDINNATEYLHVQDAEGHNQFFVTEGNKSLRFEGLGDAQVYFDDVSQKVTFFVDIPSLPPGLTDILNVPVYVWQPVASLPNAKQIMFGKAISQTGTGPAEFTFDVLNDNSTIGTNVSNQLFLLDGAVTDSKISNDGATGDKIIQVINNANSEVIDGSMLPSDIVYLDTAPASGDIEGTFRTGLFIGSGSISPDDLTPGDYSSVITSGTYDINITGNAATADKLNNALSAGTGLTGGPYDGSAVKTFSLTNTGVTAGNYGSASLIPTFTVDAQGRFTAAGTTTIDAATADVADKVANSLSTGTGLTGGPYDGSAVKTFSLTNTGVTAGNYGNASLIPTFTVDAQGRLSAAGTTTIDAATADVADKVANALSTGTGLTGGPYDGSAVKTFSLTNTGVTAGNYGSASLIPTFTVDAQGRLTAAGTTTIDAATADVADKVANALSTGTGLTGGPYDGSAVKTFSLTNTGVTAGNYGSASLIPTFTVDAQGRLTAAGTTTIDAATADVADKVANALSTGTGLTGGPYDGSAVKTFSLTNTGVTAGNYGSASLIPTFTVDAQGRLSAAGTTTIDAASSDVANRVANSLTQGDGITAFSFDGSSPATVGIADGGVTSAKIANGTIVAADMSIGNYSSVITSGTYSVNITGNATTADKVNNTLSTGTGLTGGPYDGSAVKTFSLTNTGVTAGAYGSASLIPTFTVDAQGRLTAAGTTTIDAATSDVADKVANALSSGTGLTGGPYDGSAVKTFSLTNTGVTAGNYGSASLIPTFTVDAQGRLTAAGTTTIDAATADVADKVANALSTGTGLTGGPYDGSSVKTFSLTNTGVTAGNYGSASLIPTFTVDAQGRLTAAGTTTIDAASSDVANRVANSLTQGDGITAFSFDGSSPATVGIADGGVTSAKIANGTIVAADMSIGDYSSVVTSGTYSVNITGNASTSNKVNNALATGTGLTGGPYDGSAVKTFSLTNTGVTAGNYGSASLIPTFMVDAQGRLTAAGTTTIDAATADVADKVANSLTQGDGITAFSFDGSSPATVGITDGGVTSAKIANGTIVAADMSIGDYSSVVTSGTYSVNITGNASTSNKVNNALATGTGLTGGPYDGSEVKTFSLTNTSVTAGSYGSASLIPTFTVDAQGRLTAAGTTTIDAATADVADKVANALSTGTGLTGGPYDGSSVKTFSLTNTGVTAGNYGSASLIPTFTVDAQGRLTAAGTTTIDAASADVTDKVANSLTQGDGISAFTFDGSLPATVGIADDGVTSAKISNGTIVPIDMSPGDYSSVITSGTYSVNITGNAATANKVNNALATGTGLIGGSYDGSSVKTFSLTNTGITAGSYGTSTQMPTFTVDAQGRLTSAGTTIVNAATAAVSDRVANSLSQGEGITSFTYDGSSPATVGIADGGITSAKIANGTITNDDVSTTAAINVSKLGATTTDNGKILKVESGVPTWSQNTSAGSFSYSDASTNGSSIDLSNASGTVFAVNKDVVGLPVGYDGQMMVLINITGSSIIITDTGELAISVTLQGKHSLILFWSSENGKWYPQQ